MYPIEPRNLVITGQGETEIQITDCVHGGSVFIPTDVAVAIFPADLIFELLRQRSIKQGVKREHLEVVDHQEEEEEEEYSEEPKTRRSKKKTRSEKTGKVNPYNVYCESFPSGTFGGSDYLKKRAEIGLRWKALSKEEQQPFRDEAKRRNDLQKKEEAGVPEVTAAVAVVDEN